MGEMKVFRSIQPFPGVWHITDAMGVSFTLIEGEERAILFDAGYGLEDVAAYVRTVTEKPVKVILSHGHHDHILGARWFDECFLCAEDEDEFLLRTAVPQRESVKRQAEGNGLTVPADFLTAAVPAPVFIRFEGKTGPYGAEDENLGGRTVRMIHVPGHTAGSVVCWVPDCGLLLTGDDWNPCTWMWFPCSMGAKEWRENMKALLTALEADGGEILHVLCSHQPMVREGAELKAFLAALTDEALKAAPAVDMGSPIHTREFRDDGHGWVLIFDGDKQGD